MSTTYGTGGGAKTWSAWNGPVGGRSSRGWVLGAVGWDPFWGTELLGAFEIVVELWIGGMAFRRPVGRRSKTSHVVLLGGRSKRRALHARVFVMSVKGFT